MIDRGSKRLLLTTSVVALLAGADMVHAATFQNITITAATSFVALNPGDVVNHDVTITSTGVITPGSPGGEGILVDQAIIGNDLRNDGQILISGKTFAAGIAVEDAFVGDDVINHGTIAINEVVFGTGIFVGNGAGVGTGVGNNIRNEGLIEVTALLSAAGIVVADGVDVTGHITNSGTISVSGANAVGILVTDDAVVENGIINSPKGEILANASESAVGIRVGPGSVVGNGIRNSGLIDVVQSQSVTSNSLANVSRFITGNAVGIDIGANRGIVTLDALPVASGSDIFITGGISNSGGIDVSSVNSIGLTATGTNASVAGFVQGSAVGIDISERTGLIEQVAPAATHSGTLFDLVSVDGGIGNSGLIDVGSDQVASVTASGQTARAESEVFSNAVGIAIDSIDEFGIIPLQASDGLVVDISGGIRNSGLINVNGTAIGSSHAVAAGAGAVASAGALVEGEVGGILAGPNRGLIGGIGGPILAPALISTTSGLFISGGITNNGSISVSGVVIAAAIASATGTGTVSASGNAEGIGFAGGISVEATALEGDVLNSSNSSIDVANFVSVVGHAAASGAAATAEADVLAFGEASGLAIAASSLDGNVVNKGRIAVTQQVSSSIDAQAVASAGAAQARADEEENVAIADGMAVEANFLGGNVVNSGSVDVANFLTSTMSAKATAPNGSASATASNFGIAEALGVIAESGFHDGATTNSGAIDVSGASTIDVSAVANSAGGEGGAATAEADGVSVDVAIGLLEESGFSGGVTNSGSVGVTGVASVEANATASGSDASAFAGRSSGEEGGNAAVVSVAGVVASAGTFGGDLNNTGSVDAVGSANNNSNALAIATTGTALAIAGGAALATVQGVVASFGTLDGQFIGKGPVTVLGQAVDNVTATAKSGFATASAFATSSESGGAVAEVNGISVSGGTMTGAFKNSGAIDVTGIASAHGSALALGNASESAHASARASATVNATGIGINLGVMQSSISNSGSVSVLGHAFAEADAKASGTDAQAFASATDPFVAVSGININIGELTGSISNKGVISVSGFATGIAKATAIGLGTTTAEATASARASAEVVGIRVDVGEMVGNFSNSGAIIATAFAQDSALASAKGSSATATASISEMFASATGIGIFVGSIAGNVSNSAAIAAQAQAKALAQATANGTAGNAAATATLTDASADATGIIVEAGIMNGNISNSGALTATALVNAKALATATAIDDATATVEASASAEASGMFLEIGSFSGNVTNKGAILALATASLTGIAKASGATSASADVSITDASAFAAGIFVEAGSWTGNLSNSGAIQAQAQLAVKASALASATSNAQATAFLSDASAEAVGLDVDAGIFSGNVSNSASIDALALVKATGNAVAVASTSATALASLTARATAAGIRVDVGLISGTVSNSGAVIASAEVDATGKASANGTSAVAQVFTFHTSEGGASGAIVAEAQGIDFSAGSAIETIANSGSLTARAAITVAGSAVANAGSGLATATASAAANRASATGILVRGGLVDFVGEISNSGTIVADASVSQKMSAVASSTSNDARATAHISRASSSTAAFAAGIDERAEFYTGNIDNSGSITAIATEAASVSAKAIAPLANATAVASAQGASTADGILIHSLVYSGNITNSSKHTLAAFATTVMNANATATGADAVANAIIDTAYAFANGIRIAFDSGASFFGDITNSGAIQAQAKAVGSSVANAKGTATGVATADAVIFATAFGIDVDSLSYAGNIDNSGSITAKATAVANAQANASGATGAATANAQATANADGIHVRPLFAVGDVDNSGVIGVQAIANAKATGTTLGFASANASAEGIDYRPDASGTGNILNSGTIVAKATAKATGNTTATANAFAAGIKVNTPFFTGNVENSGFISASAHATATGATHGAFALANGIFAEVSTMTGDINNSGTILATAVADPAQAQAVGIYLFGRGEVDGVAPALLPIPSGPGTLFGDVNNSGVISVFASGLTARATGIRLDGTSVTGAINNTGLIIAAATGLDVQANAINVEKAIGPTVINQLDGGMVGDIRMSNGFGDTFNWSGGFIDGNFFGGFKATGDADVLNVFAGVDKAFDYSGNIDGLSVININTTLSAGHHVDFSFGGIVTNTGTLNVNDNGRLLLHPDAIVNVDNYNNAAGGTVGFELTPSTNPADYAHINVAKTANLDGTISADYRAGLYANTQTYEDVIVAGAQVGSFASVVDNSALLDTTVRYDGAFTVDLITKRRPGGFCGISGKTGNQSQVCEALNHAFGTAAGDGDYAFVVGEMFTLPTASAVRKAYDQLGGAQHADAIDIALRNSNYLSRAVEGRLQDNRTASELTQTAGVSVNLGQVAEDTTGVGTDAPVQIAQDSSAAKQGVSAWLRGFGNYSNVSSSSSTPYGYDSTTWGIAGGVDYQATPQFLVGLGGAYGSTEANFDPDAVSNADVNTFEVGLYASYDTGGFYVDGVANYFHNSIDTKRLIDFAAIDRTAKASYDGDGFNGYGEVGYQFRTHGFLIQPRAGLNYTYVSLGGFTEHGANGADLKVNSNTGKSLSSMLGLRFATDVDAGDGLKVTPELRIGWQHEFLDDQQQIDARFAAAPLSDFSQKGPQVGRDTALIGLGVTGDITSSISVYIDYDGQFGSGFSGNTGSAGVRFKW